MTVGCCFNFIFLYFTHTRALLTWGLAMEVEEKQREMASLPNRWCAFWQTQTILWASRASTNVNKLLYNVSFVFLIMAVYLVILVVEYWIVWEKRTELLRKWNIFLIQLVMFESHLHCLLRTLCQDLFWIIQVSSKAKWGNNKIQPHQMFSWISFLLRTQLICFRLV